MLRYVEYPISCGIRFIQGESAYTSVNALFSDMAKLNFDASAHRVWVWTHQETLIGPRIAEYIKEHKLGEVVASVPGGNPTHGGRKIIVWTWTRDNTAFAQHCLELRAADKAAKEALAAAKVKTAENIPLTPVKEPINALPRNND